MQDVEEEGAGIAVPATVDGLEKGLRRILSASEEEIAEMGRRGRRLVADNYTWQKVGERLADAYISAFRSPNKYLDA